MATILTFPQQDLQTSRVHREPPTGGRTAEILLFTGVRYERHATSLTIEDAAEAKPTQASERGS